MGMDVESLQEMGENNVENFLIYLEHHNDVIEGMATTGVEGYWQKSVPCYSDYSWSKNGDKQ